MMNNFRFTNEKCPVCGENFAAEDDIVVCPLCGAPHHRDCYKKNGECAHSDRHNEGFVWQPENAPEEHPAEQNPQANPYGNANVNPQTMPFGAPVPPQAVFQIQNPLNAFPPELEEGVSTADASAYIKQKSPNYLRKFFTEKSGKRTFNFCAFLFGGYWFIYRKMYKLGAVFIAISLVLSTIPLFVPQYTKLQDEIDAVTTEFQNIDAASDGAIGEMNASYSKMLQAVKKYPVGAAVGILTSVCDLALSIYLGFIANKKYKEHIVNNIKSINSANPDAPNDELRKYRIMNEGGRSFPMALLAVAVAEVVQFVITLFL